MYKLKTDSPDKRKVKVEASETIKFKERNSKSNNTKAETLSNKLGFKKTMHILMRVFSIVSPYRVRYIICGVLATGEMAIAFIMPYLFQMLVKITSEGLTAENIRTSLLLIGILVILIPVVCFGSYVQRITAVKTSSKFRKIIFNHIQKLSISKAIERKTGDYITIMNRDVDRAAGFLQGFTVTTIFKFFVLVTGSAIVLFKSDWRMTLISIVLSVSSFLITTLINPRGRALDMDAQQASADAASNLQELSNGLPVVQIFGLQKYLEEKFEAVCQRILSKQIKSRLFYGLNEMIIFITSFSAQPISFIIGIFLVSRGELTIDELVLISGYAGVMAEGMRNLSMFLKFIQNSLVSAQRVFNLLDTPVEEEGVTLLPPDLSAENAIVLENLCFSYPNNSRVIDNLSVEIKNGETVGIVGASGSGKTTLLNLLQAIYLPESGDIRLFNRSIRELSLSDIRALSASVPQDSVLFDATIYDNIRWGKPECSEEEVYEAAKKAYIHDFIMSLPQGYQTIIEDCGARLSGGQRQRLSIARAFLKDAPILLLDEFTSALDAETEQEVLKALESLKEGRTVLIISHRESTMQNVNKVISI